ncbi:HNH endonuclease [Rhodococcus gordoniae]
MEIQARVGQGKFRTALLRKYGLSCAVTGPCPAEALEAAHLIPFAEHETHDVDSGLLLRSDIHRLFDAGSLAINPDTGAVELAAELLNYPAYRDLHGRKITQSPSVAALRSAYSSQSWPE